MSRAIKYLLNSGLSRGWGAWLEMAAMEHELVQMLRKGLSFILFHKEAPAFAGWRHFVVVKKDAERGWGMIGRALKYLKHHELARCLNAWRSTFAEETRKEGSLRRALGHFVHRELSVGWSTWAAEAAEGVRLGELLYNCLRTIVLQRESLALRGWKHAHRQRVRKLNAMAHAFRHLRNQKLSAGWGTWVAKTARRGGAMHQLLSRSMHFLLNHELSRVWNQWVTTWAELERKRAALRRGFGHLKLRFRSRGWNAWAARTHETREASPPLLTLPRPASSPSLGLPPHPPLVSPLLTLPWPSPPHPPLALPSSPSLGPFLLTLPWSSCASPPWQILGRGARTHLHPVAAAGGARAERARCEPDARPPDADAAQGARRQRPPGRRAARRIHGPDQRPQLPLVQPTSAAHA